MNWGKGITIFMIAFIAFIGSMVYYAFTMNADLVEENYYEHEINYDQNKISKSNYEELEDKVAMNQIEEGVQFVFPEQFSSVTGKIFFYRPDQKKYDREFELMLDNNRQQILDYQNFKEGFYEVTVEWNDGAKSYIYNQDIRF